MFLASIVFSGALDGFPGFKFVLGEAGVGWLPYILDRMDEEYEGEQEGQGGEPARVQVQRGYRRGGVGSQDYLAGFANPVTVTLTIGNDSGSAMVTAEFDYSKWNLST